MVKYGEYALCWPRQRNPAGDPKAAGRQDSAAGGFAGSSFGAWVSLPLTAGG